MNHPTPEQIKTYITDGLACEHIELEGDGQHFYATIVSATFDGQRTLARQRAVYAVLGDSMVSEIHALSMKTYTPAEWQARQ
ncbi:MAG: BolA family protein [Formosimonas sp.]